MTASPAAPTVAAPAPASRTGFGFDEIMGNPVRTRFTAWYAQFSQLAPDSGTATVRTAPVSKSGFGFDDIMRNPDYTRFTSWYGEFSCLAPGSDADVAGAVRAAMAAGIDPFELADAA
jgi:hypothetical protein